MNPSPPDLTESAPALPEAATSSPPLLRLGRVALTFVVLVVIAAVAGLFPRWRERTSLRTDTASLALPTVIVASPTPGKATTALSLPSEVRPLIEAAIYARANGFLKRWLVDLGDQVQ